MICYLSYTNLKYIVFHCKDNEIHWELNLTILSLEEVLKDRGDEERDQLKVSILSIRETENILLQINKFVRLSLPRKASNVTTIFFSSKIYKLQKFSNHI